MPYLCRTGFRRRTSEFVPKRHNDEAQLQMLFTRWLESKEVLFIASLMGVNLGSRVGAVRKKMGCRPGVPDILILEPRGKYHGMSVELKIRGGHISAEQEIFKKRLEANGYYSVIMPPTMEVIKALKWIQCVVEEYLTLKTL